MALIEIDVTEEITYNIVYGNEYLFKNVVIIQNLGDCDIHVSMKEFESKIQGMSFSKKDGIIFDNATNIFVRQDKGPSQYIYLNTK